MTNCARTKQEILDLIVGEWKRLNVNAEHCLQNGDTHMGHVYETRENEILHLMKMIGISADGR